MTWLLWRQHRVHVLAAVVLLAGFAVPVTITGRNLADALATCRSGGACGDLFAPYGAMTTAVNLTVAVPLVFGIFWGVSVIGRELETGTITLAWSQSVTRRTWVRSKLLWLFGSTLIASSALAALVTWWSHTSNAIRESRFAGLPFDLEGLSPVGYSLFCAALGLTAGVALRRVLPAVAATIVGFIGVRMIVELALRPDYLAPVRRIVSMSAPPQGPPGSWAQGNDLLHHGRVVSGGVVNLPDVCAKPGSRGNVNQCMDSQGFRVRITYQPAGRYWTFQWIEFGIFAGLAVALVGVALVLLRRRDA